MKHTELNWFQLRFPHDLKQEAALAALSSFSGAAHGTRLVFDLSATADGITHRLAVSPDATDATLGNLRAAIPSLRVQPIEAPAQARARRVLWQLSPVVAALRTDELGAIAASLLSSLFPLEPNESVRLLWTLRPAPRPRLPDMPDSQLVGRVGVLRAKLALPGLVGHGELRVSTAHPDRTWLLMQRTSAVLRSLSTPHGSLMADPYWYGQLAHLFAQRGRYLSAPSGQPSSVGRLTAPTFPVWSWALPNA